ncbi:nucleoside phosphorylase [Candidatus Methylomirabilis lanthanidiphila]|uniref:Nucleoside phosphorylase n=1 Tax=Candidatus Methylomirabilis lanthanidiphila TaxID=2211376 RepID=A0A564ZLR6_9BACT|nr:nucleoside phosphorylase [Candidatus Methylomirabilis lanthanidiphila]
MTTARPTRPSKISSAPFAVFVPTRAEMKPITTALQSTRQSASRSDSMIRIAVGDRVLLLARTGVGPDHAEAAARRLFEETPIAAAVSLGVAGGLSPQAQTGDLIVGDRVILRRSSGQVLDREKGVRLESFPCDSRLQDTATTVLRRWGSRHHLGPILTVDRIVLTEEKHRLAVESGAIALDMESAAIASAASARSIPFLAVRGVLDTVDEDLAMGFDQFLDGRGEPQPLLLIRYLIGHPFTVPHMVGLGLRTKAVCARLGRLLQELSTSLS